LSASYGMLPHILVRIGRLDSRTGENRGIQGCLGAEPVEKGETGQASQPDRSNQARTTPTATPPSPAPFRARCVPLSAPSCARQRIRAAPGQRAHDRPLARRRWPGGSTPRGCARAPARRSAGAVGSQWPLPTWLA
jgi:hypothetical protein